MLQQVLPFALAALVASTAAHGTTSQATAPVGFMRYTVTPGLQTAGFPLLNAAAATGRIEAVDATSLFTTFENEFAARLDPTRAYYLEITAGPEGESTFVGDRIEIDVARTTDAANAAHRIRLQLGSAYSTLRILPDALVGYCFVIRAHVTLQDVLGAGADCALQAGSDTSDADQVYLLHRGVYQSFILAAGETPADRHWIKFPEGNIADDLPIAPGMGVFVRHVGPGAVSLRHVGAVRTHAFVQPLDAGDTLVSEPFPVEHTFETRGMTAINGFTAGPSAGAADTVSVWAGDEFRTLYFAQSAEGAPSWRYAEAPAQSGAGAAISSGVAFSPFRAVLVQKLAADPDYVVPSAL